MILHLQHKKRILAILIALLMGTGSAWAYDFSAVCPSGQTLYYNITDATNHYVALVSPNNYNPYWSTQPTGNLTIPETVTFDNQTFTVTTIGNFAFFYCNGLTGSLTIPNSVTSIGNVAFSGCSGFTGSLTIPNSVTSIGSNAFDGCGFTGSLTIPNSVTEIGAYAFKYCSGITGNLTIGNSVTSIGNGAFSGCIGLTSMCVLGTVPPTLASDVFSLVDNLIPVYVPCESVDAYMSASWGGFSNFTCHVPIIVATSSAEGGTVSSDDAYPGTECTLTATPSAGYTFLNWMENGEVVSTEAIYTFTVTRKRILTANFVSPLPIAFVDTNVKDLCVASATGWDTNNDGELSYAEAAAVTSIGTVFKGKTNIQSFNELEHFISLTAIDERAFMGCTVLAEITIPENIATIGDKAFVNCPALATVHFNAINCTSMSTSYNNENYSVFMSNQTTFPLTNLTIGSSVQNIPDYAFRGCNQIQNLTIPASVTKVGDYAFSECPAIETLTIGGDAIGNYAFSGCTNLEILTLVGGQIGEYAFYGCTNLATLTIGEGVTSIGHCAFWNCPVLTTVHYNATNCTKMGELRDEGEDVFVPNGMSYWLPRPVFYCVFNSGTNSADSSPIVNWTIGDNVTRIPECAFFGCSGLTGSLTIPNSVTTIGDFAFMNCTGFTGNLTLGNSVITIGAGAFQGCSGFTGDLVIPNSVTMIGGRTDTYNEIDPSSGFPVPQIYGEYGAFYGCEGFSGNLIIPNSVTTIGDHAFRNCSGFTGSLTISNSVTSIGDGAFMDCTGFTGDLIIPNSVIDIRNGAFMDCTGFTGDLIIPNSVQRIGESSFSGCSNFDGALIIGRNLGMIGGRAFSGCNSFTVLITETPSKPWAEEIQDPAWPMTFLVNGPLFDGMNQNIPVYVPAGQISDYQNDEQWQWSYFTNYVEQVKFEQAGNNQWSDEFNWPTWEVPGSTDVVCIADNCQLDVDANVLFLYVLDNEDVLTINNGKTLTTTYGVDTRNASQLVVADGGQLIQSNTYLKATMQKHIDAYTSKDDGWNFIASPVTEGQSISGLIPTGETVYDLFYLDEENSYWKNYKVNTFDINNKQGYLYANSAGTTINFSGTMQPYVAEGVSIPLTKEGEGWNLVGNPFTFNAYANKPYYVINGRNVEAAASGAIAPCTGIIVKANGTENEAVTFTKDAPVTSSAQNHGNLQIALKEASTRSTSQIDKAIVSFNEGTTLPKFRFGDDAEIYLPLNGKDYAIVCTETTGEVPLYFKAMKNGEYTLTVNPENVEMDYLHLIDNLTGNDIDLLATPSYTFTAKVNNYNSRFRLVFSANNNDLDNNDNFAFISNGQLVVAGEGTLQIIDILGHQLYAKQISTLTSNLTPLTSPGVYVLRLTNGKNVKTQKLIVK